MQGLHNKRIQILKRKRNNRNKTQPKRRANTNNTTNTKRQRRTKTNPDTIQHNGDTKIMELKLDQWMKTLIYLEENPNINITQLTRGLNTAYPHTINICKTLQTKKLINKNNGIGRNIILELTTTGRETAQHIKEIKKSITKEE